MTTFSRAIIVHGGAGPITDGSQRRRVEGCRAAAQAGWEVLDRGRSAVDAVEASVTALEDDPLFNAGTGSTLNSLGEVEMDAAIMDGNSLRAGAVAAVQGIKNPVKLARRVMEDGRHILLAGEGALLFASQMGIPQIPPESLIVASARKRWQEKHGTVGAVALDSFQKIAVATSTGGIFNKLPGRVGDSPLLGCGTYADETGGVSCTGDGEAIMRILMAKSALDILRSGMTARETAGWAVTLLAEKTGSTAGLIVVDRQGQIGYAHSTSHMPVCWITADGGVNVSS